MAEIVPNTFGKSSLFSISNGESIRIAILNADGTLKTVIYEDQIPVGKALSGSVSYSGAVANV